MKWTTKKLLSFIADFEISQVVVKGASSWGLEIVIGVYYHILSLD